jgi:hypothetical protein
VHRSRVCGSNCLRCDVPLEISWRPGRCCISNGGRSGWRHPAPRCEHPAGPPTGHALTRTGANTVRKAPEMASIDRARARARQSGATPQLGQDKATHVGGGVEAPSASGDRAGRRARRKLKRSIFASPR